MIDDDNFISPPVVSVSVQPALESVPDMCSSTKSNGPALTACSAVPSDIEMETALSSDLLMNAGQKVTGHRQHSTKDPSKTFLATEGNTHTGSVNSKSRLTLDVVLVFDEKSNKVSIDRHEKMAEEHPQMRTPGSLL